MAGVKSEQNSCNGCIVWNKPHKLLLRLSSQMIMKKEESARAPLLYDSGVKAPSVYLFLENHRLPVIFFLFLRKGKPGSLLRALSVYLLPGDRRSPVIFLLFLPKGKPRPLLRALSVYLFLEDRRSPVIIYCYLPIGKPRLLLRAPSVYLSLEDHRLPVIFFLFLRKGKPRREKGTGPFSPGS